MIIPGSSCEVQWRCGAGFYSLGELQATALLPLSQGAVEVWCRVLQLQGELQATAVLPLSQGAVSMHSHQSFQDPCETSMTTVC